MKEIKALAEYYSIAKTVQDYSLLLILIISVAGVFVTLSGSMWLLFIILVGAASISTLSKMKVEQQTKQVLEREGINPALYKYYLTKK